MQDELAGRPAMLRAMYVAIAVLVVVGAVLAVVVARRSEPAASHGTTATTGGGTRVTQPTGSTPVTQATAPTPPPVPPLGHGEQGTSKQIPWGEVGPGWTLAGWTPVASRAPSGPQSLFVVDPAGGRYLVTATLPAGTALAAWSPASRVAFVLNESGTTLTAIDLASGATLWDRSQPSGFGGSAPAVSGDGQRLLIVQQISDAVTSSTTTQFTELGARSGQTLHQFTIGGAADGGYTLPHGLAVVVEQGGTLRRAAPDGTPQITFPASFSAVGAADGSWLYTADGSEVVMGAAGGLAVVLNSGSVVAQVPVPGAASAASSGSGCEVLGWWAPGVVLASCPTADGTAYWQVPLSAAAPAQVAAAGMVFGRLWSVGSAVFGMSGACGTTWIDQLGRDGQFRQVAIPGLQPSEQILGVSATGERLEVLGALGGCDAGQSAPPPASALVWFDPSADTSTFLLGPSVNGGSVVDALAYPQAGQD